MPHGIASLKAIFCRIAIVNLIGFFGGPASADHPFSDVVTRVARDHDIPTGDAAFFAERIAAIQASPNAVVSEAELSPWRQRRMLAAIEDWGRSFPPAEERSEAIVQGHACQWLQMIAPLHVVAPRSTTPENFAAIEAQLSRIRNVYAEAMRPRIITALTALLNVEGSDEVLPQDDLEVLANRMIQQALQGLTLEKDDDANPGPRHPIPEREFADVENRVRTAALNSPIEIQHLARLIDRDEWRAVQSADCDDQTRRAVEASKEILCDRIGLALRGNDSAFASLEKAYGDTVPASVTKEFRQYRLTLESLIDTKAIEQGFKERSALAAANQERWVAERRREFELIVASQPPLPPDPPAMSASGSRSNVFLIVNSVLVSLILAALAVRHFRRVRR